MGRAAGGGGGEGGEVGHVESDMMLCGDPRL